MLNRKIAPKIHSVENINFQHPKEHRLSNGIRVWEVHTDKQDVIKLDLFFRAGRPFEHKKMVARACSRLLQEGTKGHNSAQISEIMDYHGASLANPVDLDTSNMVLYCLSKHFEKLLPVFAEILKEPIFPKEELEQFKQSHKQKLLINEAKVDVKAYRLITESIFGPDHPYGYNSSLEGFDALTQEDLFKHFQKTHTAKNAEIIISGHTNPKVLALLDKHFGDIPTGTDTVAKFSHRPEKVVHRQIPMEGVLQKAIRIGFRTFKRDHPDYEKFYILNTILGGYFGSRLMMNIREDKGYTYNIFSSLDTMVHDGYFYIGTEVGKDFEEDTLKQIYLELDRLKEEEIQKVELDMVQNYLMGNLLNLFDGPLAQSEVVKRMRIHQVPFETVNKLVKAIRSIKPSELQETSNKYFQNEEYFKVIIGG